MSTGFHASLLHINRHSHRSVEVAVRCSCTLNNSSVAIIESSNCIPVMPVSYGGGCDFCRVLAFTRDDLNRVVAKL